MCDYLYARRTYVFFFTPGTSVSVGNWTCKTQFLVEILVGTRGDSVSSWKKSSQRTLTCKKTHLILEIFAPNSWCLGGH